MRAASSALSRVYSRFEPGGVSSAMMNSERSSSGKNPVPTVRTGVTFCGRIANTASPTMTMTVRGSQCIRLRVNANTTIAMPTIAAASPLNPRVGSKNEAKNVSAAIIIIATRWSSAHAMTRL